MLGRVLFAKLFHCEHREMLELLVDLVFALGRRDLDAVRRLAGRLSQVTGPHLRYEEEALYPALAQVIGETRLRALMADHDQIIDRIARLEELRTLAALDEERAGQGLELVRPLVHRVAECDRLSSLIGRLSDQEVEGILAARAQALEEDLNVLHWSAWMRGRRDAGGAARASESAPESAPNAQS